MDGLRNWLSELGLIQFLDTFVREGVDLDVAGELTDEDLQRLGLSLGQRRRFLKAARDAPGYSHHRPALPSDRALSEPPAKAERRQISVLFCDLVNSMRLAEQLGEEAFSDVIRSYQQMCTTAIERFDGHLARYMGDGILAYFGFPVAHEDDPQRAVRAGLALIGEAAALSARVSTTYRTSVAVRVGIHTGPVVAGDLSASGAFDEISGVTPNIAARLQTVAAPNTVLIGPLTRELLYDHFDCTALGPKTITGVSQPVPVFRVDAERRVESRFHARTSGALTPLIGREPELGLLLDRWGCAEQGDGQFVVVSGEAGIGKSRLVEGLRQAIGKDAALRIGFQCSPHHVSSAFYPFIEQFERAAKWARDDPPERRLARMEEILAASGEDLSQIAPFIASMLTLPAADRYALPEMSPRQLRDRTIEAIVAQVAGLSRRHPVLIVFEDAHWTDPTSLDVLQALAAGIERLRVMVVVTCRPDGRPQLPQAQVSSLVLNRLSRRERRDLALKIAGDRPLADDLLTQIVEKTDGVPLFVEELTRTALEAGAARTDKAALVLPPTLQDSLMARLDRIPIGKEVAQIGAVIGRDFSFEMLLALSPLPEPRLRAALDTLVETEIVLPRGPAGRGAYTFKHALVQEAAYRSLLSGRRREIHGETAKVLDKQLSGGSKAQPELIAHHYTESGDVAKAVDYWLEAGRLAASRSANAEAVLHLNSGLRLVENLPASPDRDRVELDLLIALGPALINAKGGGVADVERAYARAVDMCERLPVGPKHFAVFWGRWRISANFEIKRARADRLHAIADQLAQPGLLLQANHAEWATLYGLGDFPACCARIDRGLEIYEAGDFRWQASIYGGHDAKVCALGEAGVALWLQGFPDRAVIQSNRGLEWSRELMHAGSRAHALDYALMLHWFRRDAKMVALLAAELIELSEHQRFGDYHARARVYRGWARSQMGDAAAGVEDMQAGVEAQRTSASNEDFAFFLDMLAHGQAAMGRDDQQRRLVTEALEQMKEHGVRHWLAELRRREAELLLAVDGDAGRAWERLDAAARIASDQGARSLSLRLAMSQARLARREDAPRAAAVLKPALDRFDEGFDTADLIEARSLMAELKAATVH